MPIELVNGAYDTSIFPGGEVHVIVTKPSVQVKAIIKNSEDIMRLLLLNDALKRMGYFINELYIPYFPYARQDRVCNKGEALSVKVMADLINTLGVTKVLILDPHSDVLMPLLDRCVVTKPDLTSVIGDKLVVCPDAGAEKRILKLKRPYVMATKVRDVETGDILETRLYGDVEGRDCIIVDDICDGGRTFIELAKVLKAAGANTVDLYVTHGIFSKGMSVFGGLIDNVYHCNYQTGVVEKCL